MLHENNFSDFSGVRSLRVLHLHENNFSGSLPDFRGLQSLTILYLQNNGFSINLPDFTGLQSFEGLYLYLNKFSGSIPDFTGCSSLEELRLDENQVTEWRTQSIGQLKNLQFLDLSMNSIRSTKSESHLFSLSSLDIMIASSNSLTFNISSGWRPLFQLSQLSLGSCKLGPKFPNWIRNQTKIITLDFSNSQISDTIPMWFWNISRTLISLDLSANKIRGEFPKLFDIPEVDLSSNNFEGQMPLISSRSLKINLSNNKFSGQPFSLSAVEHMDLTNLDCSHNLLFGVLPTSWMYFPGLAYLNLGHNNFSGIIPMSIGHLTSLQTLILRDNFYGGLPDSLRNCTNLGFADFELNNISGKMPEWIGDDLPQLFALILKSNKFSGSMPRQLCHLSNLHFLDLSINRISGTVPPCFDNFTTMIQNGTETAEHYYDEDPGSYDYIPRGSFVDNALAGWKGNILEYGRNFAYLKMIDLSSNELTGEIPIGITRLLDLKGLNLSGNKFYGEVPEEIGGLKMLESLDLSGNKFSGEIPQTMSRLHFLSYLDLSNNNFSGRIPSGTQLQGFNSTTYKGNVRLCGPPLKKICPRDEGEGDVEVEPSDGNESDEDEIEYKRWLYISAAVGFGTTFWGICGMLVLNRHWRQAYFLFLNNMKDRIYVIIAVGIARIRS